MASPASARCAGILVLTGLVVSLTLSSAAAHADQAQIHASSTRPAADDDAPGHPFTAIVPPLGAGGQTGLSFPALLPALSCLAALISCAFSVILWRRVDSAQEAAKSSMYAAGKLFDSAARRFSRAQDEAGSAVEAASGAAGQAGQAAARLAAAVREAEARLSACVGEGEARLQTASTLLARNEGAAANLPRLLDAAVQGIGAGAVPAIEEAAAALRACAEASATMLLGEVRRLPVLMAEAMEAADAKGATALLAVVATLRSRAAHITSAADALPLAGAALTAAAETLNEAQARHTALIARVEALAGVLPSIATSLASTAAGQRQLLSQGKLGVETGIVTLRQAALSLSACVDEAGLLLRRAAEGSGAAAPRPPMAPSSMHPALRPRDLGQSYREEAPLRRQIGEDASQPG